LLKSLLTSPICEAVGGFQSFRSGRLESGRSDAEGQAPASRVHPDAPPSSLTQPYNLLHVGSTDLIASLGPCLIVLSYTITLAGVEAIGRGLAKLTQGKQKACSISFVERTTGPGTASDARQAITEIARKYESSLSSAAIVCGGTGFRATAVRSVVTAIHMASRATYPTKVFSTDSPAFEWLQGTRPNADLDLTLLTEATTALRARLQERMMRAAAGEPRL
jgi:hypothetical protein